MTKARNLARLASVNTSIVGNTVFLSGNVSLANATLSLGANTINSTSLTSTGVVANSYGNTTAIPVITVDAAGRITNATTSSVSGVTGLSYTAANSTVTVSTSTTNFNAIVTSGNSTVQGLLTVIDSVSNTSTLIAGSANSVTTAYLLAANAVSNATAYAATAYSNAVSTAASDATTKAGTAYSNAISVASSDATTKAGTAYSNAIAYANTVAYTVAGTAYSNAVATAASDATTKAGTAYSNATTYAATVAGTAYSNATAYADTKAGTAYSNATAYADTKAGTAYSNAVAYTDIKAGNAYSNAASYADTKAAAAYSNVFNGGTFSGAVTVQANLTANSVRMNGNLQVDGDLTVSGNTVTINVTNLNVEDNMIYLNSNSMVSHPDLGFAGNYNDGSYKHAGLFRDATDGVWKFFHGYTPEPDASAFIDTANASFTLSNLQINYVIGNVTGSANSATYLGGNTAATLRSYSDTMAGTAYSNATSYAATIAGTAYSNAVSVASSDATTKAGTAYSNATTYAATIAGTAYSNAVSVASSDATTKAGTAYSNATAFAANASNISSGTLSASRLPATYLTSVTGTAPVVSSGGATPAISMAAANSTVAGYMTTTYASKLDGIATGATNVTNNNQLTNGAGYITGSGNTTGSAGSVVGLTLTSSSNAINPDSVTQNQLGYNSSVSLFGQTDGGLYSSAYSSSWVHQIYGDFRTGQIAIRGKNSGTWQAWRTVLDSSNYTSYSPSLTGSGASGTWSINVTGYSKWIDRVANYTWSNSTLPSGYNSGVETSFVSSAEGWPNYGVVLSVMGRIPGDPGGNFQLYMGHGASYGGLGLRVRSINQTNNAWTSWKILLDESNYTSYAMPSGSSATNSVDVRAPIFYDSDNTSYYTNPAGVSVFSDVRINDGNVQLISGNVSRNTKWRTLNGTTDIGISLYSAQDVWAMQLYANAGEAYGFLNGNWAGWDLRKVPSDKLYLNGQSTYFYNGDTAYLYRVYATGDTRSAIYYDNNDTGYYVDPNSTSNINALQTAGQVVFGGTFGNNNYNAATGRISFGGGANIESYFIGTNIENYGGSYTKLDIRWHTGIRMGAQPGYGGIRFYDTEALGTQVFAIGKDGSYAQANQSMRAPIFYDLDNTGYYIDAAATSVMNRISTVRTNDWLYLDNNYGHSVVGVYTHTIFQGVFAMGDAYKLTAGGGINNLYGMTWSYPSAGGIAGNLDSHGMIVAINGGFGSCMSYSIKASGNVTAYSDERLKTNWRNMPEDFVARLAKVKVGIYDRVDGEKITQVGVSAQSLQTLLPQAVTEANDDIKTLSVSYGNAAMASAVELAKEVVSLKQTISSQEERIAKLEALVNNLLMR